MLATVIDQILFSLQYRDELRRKEERRKRKLTQEQLKKEEEEEYRVKR